MNSASTLREGWRSISAPRPGASPMSCIARGAAKVYAVDVGSGQLHAKLRVNPKVVSLEGTDARTLDRSLIREEVTAIVADVSFISLTLALPAALRLAAPGAWLVALVKPQFEAGRDRRSARAALSASPPSEQGCGKGPRLHRRSGLDGRRRDRLPDSRRQRQRGIPDRRAPWSLRSRSSGSARRVTAWRTAPKGRSSCPSPCLASGSGSRSSPGRIARA